MPLLPYQREDIENRARFRWCCWSRQTGKSFTKSLRRILRGLQRGRNQIFLSAGERQSRELMIKARQHCQALKIAFDYFDSSTFRDCSFRQLELQLPNRVRVIALPANPQTARGYSGDVFLDEFAMHAEDRDVWGAMFPTLLRGGGELDVASTPKGRKNVFYELGQNDAFSRSVLTLPQAVAQGLDVDVDTIRRTLGDDMLYRQEFLCEFLDEATAFLTYEQIAACEDAGLRGDMTIEQLHRCGRDLYLGVDIGRKRDLTVMWVVALESRQENSAGTDAQADGGVMNHVGREGGPRAPGRLVTAAIFVLAQAAFREQERLLHELLSLPNLRRCCVDAGGLGMQLAESAVERFGSQRVEAVMFTAAVKAELAGGLRVAVENRRIVIPVDDALRNDWHSVERRVSTTGHFHFSAERSEGSHADRFWAAALAVRAAGEANAKFEGQIGGLRRFTHRGAW